MMIVHDQLYRTPDLAQIDFAAYLHTLTSNLIEAYQVTPGHVTLDLEVDDIVLKVDQAIPCGLMVTELVTNALKYAFPVDQEGERIIRVVCHRTAAGQCELVVSDNGIGLPEDFRFPTKDTVGMLLLEAHARGLKATIEWRNDQGTACYILFGA
jgi:two-component sensor histidine kinase